MHTRERGAAHINIFYFLIMLVLFLGALGFASVQMTENTTLREEIKNVRAESEQVTHDLEVLTHYTEDMAEVVGETGSYAGRDGFVYDLKEGALTQKSLEGVALPNRLKSLLQEFARDASIPESTATPVQSLLSQTKQVLASKEKRISDVVAENASLTNMRGTLEANVSTANQQKTDEVSKLNDALAELQQGFESAQTALQETITGLRDQVRNKTEELDQLREQHVADQRAWRNMENQLRGRNNVMAAKIALVNPPQEPDGTVMSSSEAAEVAWIDLGRRDMLPRGTVFEIISPDTGATKGYGRVNRVEFDRSELALYGVVDRYDPITKGDLVRNDVYSAGVRRNVFLMGRFGYPMDKPSVKLALEQLGNTVHDSIGPAVDLVIVGGDTISEEGGFTAITESDEYKQALQLGIEIAPFNKVREFVKLSTEE